MTRTHLVLSELGLLVIPLLVAGCGANTNPNERRELKCSLEKVLNVFPATATVDQTFSAPGNSQQFTAIFNYTSVPPGCPVPLLAAKADVTWSLSDASNANISNAQDATNGVAACTGTSTSPITVTAVSAATPTQGPAQTATATLICK